MITFNQYLVEEEESPVNIETPVYEIPDHNMSFLQAKIDKLNKTAKKLNVAPIIIEKQGEYYKRITDPEENPKKPGFKRNGFPAKPAYNLLMHKIVIKGEAPKLAGWSFLGKRQPDEVNSKNIFVKSAPGQVIPKKYHDDHDLKCDHCKKNARRNETFIVKKGKKTMEVGRSCLKDFLGHQNPNLYANFAESLYDIEEFLHNVEDSEYEGGGGRMVYYMDVKNLVAPAIHIIKEKGFVSKQYAYAGKPSTAAKLADHFWPPIPIPKGMTAEDFKIPVTKEDEVAADAVIEYMKNHPDKNKNEFWTNVAKMANSENVSVKNFGYIAAAVNQYLKAEGTAKVFKKMTDGIVQEPIAKVGDKVAIKGEVLSAFAYQGNSFSYYDSGVRHILQVKTDNGNLVKMFTSNGAGIKKGDRIEISGKIGSYEEEKYEKSPFKGMMMTTMAPRSRVVQSFDPEELKKSSDNHYHVGDKVNIRYTDKAGNKKNGVGIVHAKPTFGRFEIKSLKSDAIISVNYDDILGKV